MPLGESKLFRFGLRTLEKRPVQLGIGIPLGYYTINRARRPHIAKGLTKFGIGVATGGGFFASAANAPLPLGAIAGQDNLWGNYMGALGNDYLKPAIGGAIFPGSYMSEFQPGLSRLSHEDLNARYGGPNPNTDAALFVNNFDESGNYAGPSPISMAPAVGSSLGARSSTSGLGANGSLVHGLWNSRLSE